MTHSSPNASTSLISCFAAGLLAWLVPLAAHADEPADFPQPPDTRRVDVEDELHGEKLIDPYRWLEDQQAPETRAWIDEQNAYTESVLARFPHRDAISKRLTQLLRVDETSMPTARADRYFFLRRSADEDLASIYLREGLDGEDQLLIDPHSFSEDQTTSVSLLDVSDDGLLLAYAVRHGGEDEITVRLFDVDARRDLPDTLPRARYFGVSIAADNDGLFYTRHGESGSRLFFHVLGEDPNGDRLLFGEGYGPEKIIVGELSADRKHLLVTVYYGSAAKQTELYVLSAVDARMRPSPVTVVNDIEARFEGQIADGSIFLFTNYEAPSGRILVADLQQPTSEHWRELVPESDAILESMTLVGDRVAAKYLADVQPRVKLYDASGEFTGEIRPEQLGTVTSLAGRWTSDEAFYAFSSFNVPPTIYRYDLEDASRRVWSREKVPVESDRYVVQQVKVESKDGTMVPMFLMHRKDISPDGKRPTMLTGYGGFNISLTPRFSAMAVIWAELGGVWAMPNLRGGGEYGEEWHQAGMLERKQNVFDDFIAAAEWLIEQNYTSPERLAISGGSNGGLLVGAALTQRPELFAAVICRYPLLDMVRYHQFLVARFWVPEYGSSEDMQQFHYLRAYSPYHNVRQDTAYPAVLFVTGDADTRVDPLHARKMVALLQSYSAAKRPVLLRYDTKAGHSRGSTPVPKRVEELTDELAFLLMTLNVELKLAELSGDE